MPIIARKSIALVFCLTLTSSAALAHAHLQRAEPPVGGVAATSPKDIRLHFSEGVEPRLSGLKLTSEAGDAVPTGAPSLDPGDPSILVTPIDKPLAPGTYKVEWHAIAVDTHRTEGSFTFVVR